MPSLVDYMNGGTGKVGGAQSGGTSLASVLNANDGGGLDIVSLSADAQRYLSMQASGTSANGTATGPTGEAAQKGAISFIANFFADSGVNSAKLSDETKKLIAGLSDLITSMTNVAQDSTLDAMTKNYVKGQRESFTLQGDGQRISATVQYEDGKPKSLTVTQSNAGVANTATITLGMDNQGKLSTVDINRVQKVYNSFGGFMGSVAADPLTLALYA